MENVKPGRMEQGDGAENARLRPPAIILVEPQLGENIGQAARAMANFGLEELRLVAPRDGWPNEKAIAGASGAASIIDNAAVFSTIGDAIADLHFLGATTARIREMVKPVASPKAPCGTLPSGRGAGSFAGLCSGASGPALKMTKLRWRIR